MYVASAIMVQYLPACHPCAACDAVSQDEEHSAQLDEIGIAVEAFQEFKTEVKEW